MVGLFKVAAIAGYKKSGKTEVIERLVKELVEREYRVGTVKHTSHKGFTLDRPGTDTWRHAQAGSKMVVSISPEEFATLEKRRVDLSEVLLGLRDLDFVILEGFRESENIAKMMVARNEDEASELDDEFTVGFIGHGVKGKPVLDRDNVSALADLVELKAISPVGGLNCGECGYGSCREFAVAALGGKAPKDGCRTIHGGVILTVDGKRMPLKPFMQDLIAGTIGGMLSSLKGAKGERFELKVVRRAR